MSIEVGQVVYVKTTDEPVFVVAIDAKSDRLPTLVDTGKFSGTMVAVRRPVLTESGIEHRFDDFLIEELESRQDKEQRVFNEMEGIRAQFKGAALPSETTN